MIILNKIEGIDKKKIFEKYKQLNDIGESKAVFGGKEMKKEVFDNFPKFTGLENYNMALIQDGYYVDTNKI